VHRALGALVVGVSLGLVACPITAPVTPDEGSGSAGAAGGTGLGDTERSGTEAGNETVACAVEGQSCADADCCERLRCFQGVCGSR
jgi:hypothetical protein